MTIAIGILAQDGVVVASDREESFGHQKNNSGKIIVSWKAQPFGSLILSGAGSSHYIDSVHGSLTSWFARDSKQVSTDDVAEQLAVLHKQFYREHVVPCANYPDNDRPDYSLLIGCSMRNGFPGIWTTEKLSVNKSVSFASVGIGSSTANALLNKIYARLPVEEAVNLAAYVMYEVKESVQGCGLGTDIRYSTRKGLSIVKRREIQDMENLFREYSDMERETFHKFVGSSPRSDTRIVEKDRPKYKRIREAFKRLVVGRQKPKQ